MRCLLSLRRNGMIAPLAVAVLLRLSLMIAAYLLTGTTVMTQGDTLSYLQPGRNLLLHGSYATAGLPEMDRTPGYPVFAMLSGMLFDNVLLVIIAQIALSVLSLLLVRRIAALVFSDARAGTFAAWLYAVEPFSILYCVRVMPETLFVLLLLVVIERVIVFLRTGQLVALVLCGLALSAATYVRPVSYYLALPLAVGLIVVCWRHKPLRWQPALLLLVTMPLLAAWQVRNFVETGYSGFSSIVEKNLYYFQSAEVTAELRQCSLEQEQERLGYPDEASYVARHPEQRNWSQSQRLRFMKGEAQRVLIAHPALYLRTHLVGMGIVALTPGTSEVLQMLGAYPVDGVMPHRMLNEGIFSSLQRVIAAHPMIALAMGIMDLWLVLLYFLAVFGAIRPQKNRAIVLTLVAIALYFLVISGGAQAVGRYRLPILPVLCILAGANVKRPGSRDQLRSQSGLFKVMAV